MDSGTKILIEAISARGLAEYARLPMALQVRSALEPGSMVEAATAGGIAGWKGRDPSLWRERPAALRMKDYDALGAGGPTRWPEQFDLSAWGIWLARLGGEVVGGAAVARDAGTRAPGAAPVEMLEARADLAVLWDIRARPDRQRSGVGSALFRHAAQWARLQGCREMKIETQDVNVAACRFYARMGCTLRRVDPMAYRGQAGVEDEVMLEWGLDLTKPAGPV